MKPPKEKKQKGLTDKQLVEKYGNPKAEGFTALVKKMVSTGAEGAAVRKAGTGKK